LSKLKIKFIRGEEVKYVSHLDIMKVFERAARRARLPLAYSRGYNPRPQIVFGLPLSVGVTSEAELAEFEIEGEMNPDLFCKLLNNQLPGGFRIVEAVEIESKDNIMSRIKTASYVVLFLCREELEEVKNKVRSMMGRPEIIVEKFSKKGTKEVDIKPLIHKLEIAKYQSNAKDCSSNSWIREYVEKNIEGFINNTDFRKDDLYLMNMLVSAGNVSNLNPSLVIKALSELEGLPVLQVKIHRTGLYTT